MSAPAWIDAPIEHPEGYTRFVELFNARKFFEAHEVLEDLWVVEVGPVREYYKALIMAAVALEHWRRRNPSGARKLWRDARARRAPPPAPHEGLDLRAFRAQMDEILAPIMANGAAAPPAPPDHRLPILALQPPRLTP